MFAYSKKTVFTLLLFAGLLLSVKFVAPAQRLVDEMPYQNAEIGEVRIDGLISEVQNASTSHGFIIVYGPKVTKRGEVEAHIDQISTYIKKIRKFDLDRITVIKGGYRDSDKVTIALWLVAPGDSIPALTGTLDTKNIRFLKGRFTGKYLYWF